MTCKEFRKFLYAFADGELETRENLEVLEHLNMCPSCTRKVAMQQELRAAVTRVCPSEPAPDALRERVLANLGWSPSRRHRRWIFLAPLAAAAAIALVFILPADDTARAEDALAAAVVKTHRMCCDHLGVHHRADLPKDLTAGNALSRDLKFPVLVRNFSNADYAFHSANICMVDRVKSSHVMYLRAGDNDRLSAFTLPKRRLGGEKVQHGDFVYHLLDNDGIGIVGWNDEGASHLVCAEPNAQTVLDLVTSSELAKRTVKGGEVERSPIAYAAFHEMLDR
jgi:mycothiol system anti-sigma-R factor